MKIAMYALKLILQQVFQSLYRYQRQAMGQDKPRVRVVQMSDHKGLGL